MAVTKTKEWMKFNHLKAVTVYFNEKIFERVQELAKEDGRSKGNWVHKVVIEALRKKT